MNTACPQVLFQLNDDNIFNPKYHVYHDLIAQGAIGKVQHVSLIRWFLAGEQRVQTTVDDPAIGWVSRTVAMLKELDQ